MKYATALYVLLGLVVAGLLVGAVSLFQSSKGTAKPKERSTGDLLGDIFGDIVEVVERVK